MRTLDTSELPPRAVPRRPSDTHRDKGSMARCLWTHLPLVSFVVYAVGTAHASMANLDPPRYDLAWNSLFPFSVPLIVFGLRWRRAGRAERRAAAMLLLGAPLVVLLSGLCAPRTHLDADTLRTIYEISVIGHCAVLVVHAWTRHRALAALLLGPIALYGVVLENGGILLGYFSELKYHLYVHPLPAPVATMIGWIMVFYLMMHVTWEVRALVPAVRRTAVGSALVATATALLLDFDLDPLATAVGFWQWHELLPVGPLGVPTINFVAWACAVFPLAWVMFRRESAHRLAPGEIATAPHRRALWPRAVWALAAAAVLFLLSMAAIEGGVGGPTFTILLGEML
jgi:uncharacterized membrane protein